MTKQTTPKRSKADPHEVARSIVRKHLEEILSIGSPFSPAWSGVADLRRRSRFGLLSPRAPCCFSAWVSHQKTNSAWRASSRLSARTSRRGPRCP